ncbi:hypothetical protein AA313_de0210070 [Arthrobotrys entomopaga]|nr:hypothetical protein AA313_de0210070 [Arthrobotrys entomopaga]
MSPTVFKNRFWRRSSTSTSVDSDPPTLTQTGSNPPAYENVPIFATPSRQPPFLPPEILTEIIYWSIIPTFDETRQDQSPIHIKTLTSLSQTSTFFLSTVRLVCRDACNSHECTIPCPRTHADSTPCAFWVVATWMPIAVLAGIYKLSIFDEIVKHGGERVLVNIGELGDCAGAAVLIWDRLIMEGTLEKKYSEDIYFTYHTLAPEGSDKLLKAFCFVRHVNFAYFRLSATWAVCQVGLLEEAVGNIAPSKYLEVSIGAIKGWAARGPGEKVIHKIWSTLIPMGLPLPLKVLSAGLKNGARRVDLGWFTAGDAGIGKAEMRHSGSLVNFIRSREIPNGLVEGSSGVFAQLRLGGNLDAAVTGPHGFWKLTGNVVLNPFCYALMGVREGNLEWMGGQEKFTQAHFLNLAMKDT